jgi:hypothetical protein
MFCCSDHQLYDCKVNRKFFLNATLGPLAGIVESKLQPCQTAECGKYTPEKFFVELLCTLGVKM